MPFEDKEILYAEPDGELDAMAHLVIGAAIEVYRHLGPGLDESMREKALKWELTLQNIPFTDQVMINVRYKGEVIGERRLDLLIARKLIVELKAVEQLGAVHKAQLLTYLKISGLKLGLPINFSSVLLKDGIKRIIRS